ncbi:MAG: flagellin [Rhodospirillales bacterium]|jgi:flagellin|nr:MULTISPECIES: flagellin [Thalassospira]MBR9816691.1 flagellin [Rhodospirillales bacterium]OCK07750.1 flagellin domain protein [Thalassospira sp. KO164]PXX32704.1 flagellin [Thalassospira sp. 11-3]QPL36406.1 flagellin [Thalassospira sp. B30-1]SEE21748.1 flagellin [Thalassospira permensis]|eukprot:TRINITY_DN16173_c0_g2_i6.p1 TRINITY_DN16173_c0_g2~~TRINITY_DN16173_c0_g2_i6.p1  ORF type:complete len:460 (-),score=136.80 TRINITY_DN16173_c0_g2_i6:63-1442(-)
MALNIISNYAANVAHRNLSASDEMATRSLSKLSSGTRVVSARDDAASMAIGARLNATTQALKTATVNVGQANSMLQIADGGMATIDDILVRMKTLAVQSSSGNLSDTERGFLNDEFTQLRDEIDRISSSTNFNGIQLLGDGGDVALNYADLNTGGSGAALTPATGFSGFGITDNNLWASDGEQDGVTDNNFSVSINEVTVGGGGTQIIMTVTANVDLTAGADAPLTQSIDVTDYLTGGSKAMGPGDSGTLNFDQLGLTIDINDNFTDNVDVVGAGTGGNQDFGVAAATAFTIGGAVINASLTTVNMAADNGQQLPASIDFQVGAGNTANDRLAITLTAVDSGTLGTGAAGTGTALNAATVDITTAARAQAAVEVVTVAIDDLQRARAGIGTYQNRLDFAGQNLATTQENTESARSTLLDLDVASEMTSFTSKQILVQSGVAMLAQANQMPQNLLRLLQG